MFLQLLRFIESRMHLIAPNLSVVLGTTIAAKLIGAAGGLANLARTPACNIQVCLFHKCLVTMHLC